MDNPLLSKDIGYQETEKKLKQLEKELGEIYGQASAEMQKKALDYMKSLKEAAEEMLLKVKRGEISEKECQRWFTSHLLTAQRYRQMSDVLAADLLNVNQIAASIMNGYMPDVYAVNMNYMTYTIENQTGIDTSFTLYNHESVERLVRDYPDLLPIAKPDEVKQITWSKRHINSAILQGIMQGEGIADIAARLRMVSDMDYKASVRNARTMTTSAQNGGRLDSMRRVEKMGAKIQKQWIATLDGRTRHAHRQLDGQKKPIDQPFESEFGKIDFPGDPHAHPANVYNCRCALVTEDPEFPLDASDLSQRYSEKLKGMSYDEWKKAHAAGESKKRPVNPDNPSYGYAVNMGGD